MKFLQRLAFYGVLLTLIQVALFYMISRVATVALIGTSEARADCLLMTYFFTMIIVIPNLLTALSRNKAVWWILWVITMFAFSFVVGGLYWDNLKEFAIYFSAGTFVLTMKNVLEKLLGKVIHTLYTTKLRKI